MSSNYLSVHLFYSDMMDVFLAKALKPYADTVVNTGAAERFFFIRYEERGPHVRLRIQGDPVVLEQIIKENLQEHFDLYLRMFPSTRRAPNLHPETPASELWLPNNSIQFIDYEPETARYGGENGIILAEKQFFYSSKAVLAAMSPVLYDGWSDQYARGIAIKLHLAMICSLGLDIGKAIDFLMEVYVHWLPFAIARERVTQAQYEQHLIMMSENFELGFQEQKEEMVSYNAACWQALMEDEEFADDYMDTWIAENRRLGMEYRLAQVQGLLVNRPAEYRMKMSPDISPEEVELWNHYADFVHLTNNRLGIANEEESYLAYLMMRSLEEML